MKIKTRQKQKQIKKEIFEIIKNSNDFGELHSAMNDCGFLYLTSEFLLRAENRNLILWNFDNKVVTQTKPILAKNGDSVIIEYVKTEYAPYDLLIAVNWFSGKTQTAIATYIKKLPYNSIYTVE